MNVIEGQTEPVRLYLAANPERSMPAFDLSAMTGNSNFDFKQHPDGITDLACKVKMSLQEQDTSSFSAMAKLPTVSMPYHIVYR